MIARLAAAAMAAFLSVAGPAAADDLSELKAARAALQTAFETQDADALLSLMTPDHIAATAVFGGVVTRDDQVALLTDLKVTFSDTTDPAITLIGTDGAYVTYEESLKGTFRGEPLPSRVFASEVWVKRDGKWLERAYQETVIDRR